MKTLQKFKSLRSGFENQNTDTLIRYIQTLVSRLGSSSSSVMYRRSMASFMWLFAPLGSKSVAQEKLSIDKCALPSRL